MWLFETQAQLAALLEAHQAHYKSRLLKLKAHQAHYKSRPISSEPGHIVARLTNPAGSVQLRFQLEF